MWVKGQSGNLNGRRVRADSDWLPNETPEARQKRRARERSAKWRVDNPERVRANSTNGQKVRKDNWEQFLAQERERYANNPSAQINRQKAAREKNPERFSAARKKHYAGNKSLYVAACAARRAAKIQATPPWVNLKEIAAFFAEARRLTIGTGIPHEVDHIEPLRAKNRCGLHVPWNLQVITRADNRRKHNH